MVPDQFGDSDVEVTSPCLNRSLDRKLRIKLYYQDEKHLDLSTSSTALLKDHMAV